MFTTKLGFLNDLRLEHMQLSFTSFRPFLRRRLHLCAPSSAVSRIQQSDRE